MLFSDVIPAEIFWMGWNLNTMANRCPNGMTGKNTSVQQIGHLVLWELKQTEIVCNGVDWIHVPYDRVQWRWTVMNIVQTPLQL